MALPPGSRDRLAVLAAIAGVAVVGMLAMSLPTLRHLRETPQSTLHILKRAGVGDPPVEGDELPGHAERKRAHEGGIDGAPDRARI